MNDPRWVDNRSFHISSTPYLVHIPLTPNKEGCHPIPLDTAVWLVLH